MDTTAVEILGTVSTADPTPFYSQVTFWISIISLLIATTAIVWPAIKQRNIVLKKGKILFEQLVQVLESGIIQIEERIQYYSDLSKEINNMDKSDYYFKISPKLFQNAIDRINPNEIFSIIYKVDNKSSSNIYYNLYNVIDYLKNEDEAFSANAIQFKNDFRKYQSELRTNLSEGYISGNQLMVQIRKSNANYKADEFYRDLEIHLHNFSVINDKTLNHYYEFSGKISILCQNHINRKEAKNLYSYFVDTERLYLDIVKLKNIYSNSLKEDISKLDELKQKIINIRDFLKPKN